MDKKKLCQFGADCYRKNPDHLKEYYHPPKESSSSVTSEPKKRNHDGPQKKVLKQTKLDIFRIAPSKNVPKVPDANVAESVSDSSSRRSSKSPSPSPVLTEKRKLQQPRKRQSLKKRPTPINKRVVNESSDEESGNDTSSACDVTSNSWVFNRDSEGRLADSPTPDNGFIDGSNCETPADKIKALFLVNMPEDFYQFFEFCETVNGKSPKDALKSFGIQLVGPFDVLSGDLSPSNVRKSDALCHWRFYLDPPEMQTVLVGEKGLHYGYWRDEPESEDTFVVSNTVPEYSIHSVAANIFGAAAIHMEGYLRNCSPFEQMKGKKVLASLKQWAEDRNISLTDSSEFMKTRKKKIVAPTFHGAGIVVPVQKKTEIGYRPLIETNANLKKLCLSIKKAKSKAQVENLLEEVERLVNAANIANDEGDFGNGLELGIDLFCMGSEHFDDFVHHLLTTAYSLLNRPAFADIIKAHLKNRRTGLQLSVIPSK